MINSLHKIQERIKDGTQEVPMYDVESIRELQEIYNYDDDRYYQFRPNSLSETIRQNLGLEIDIPTVKQETIVLGDGDPMYFDKIDGYTFDDMERTNNYITNVLLQGELFEN